MEGQWTKNNHNRAEEQGRKDLFSSTKPCFNSVLIHCGVGRANQRHQWNRVESSKIDTCMIDLVSNRHVETLKPLENKCKRISSLPQVGKSFLCK